MLKKFLISAIIIILIQSAVLSSTNGLEINQSHSNKNNSINNERTTELWALIVAPPDHQQDDAPWFVYEAKIIRNTLLDSGWKESNIKTLFYEDATKENIKNAIDWIAEKDQYSDTTLIYLHDHGTKNLFWLYNNESFSYFELNLMLKKLDSCGIGIIVDACHSGSAIKWLKHDGRVIVTPCEADEVSYGFRKFYDALDGYADYYDTGDKNGVASLEEAFDYISKVYEVDPSEHPVIQDDYPGELNILFQDWSNGRIDQIVPNFSSEWDTIWFFDQKQYVIAQSFEPEFNILSKVRLRMIFWNDDTVLKISIRDNLNGEDLTSGKIYANQRNTPEYFYDLIRWFDFYTCDFPDIEVNPGSKYYILIKQESPVNYYPDIDLRGISEDYYAKGECYLSEDDGDSWEKLENTDFQFNKLKDLLFTTYGKNDNFPPYVPKRPAGPYSDEDEEEYRFLVSTEDVDGDQIYYKFDWGDGSESEWMGAFDSGVNVQATHEWSKGNYNIRVKAKDIHGFESDWSDSLPLKTSKSRFSSRYSLLEIITNILQNLQKHNFFI